MYHQLQYITLAGSSPKTSRPQAVQSAQQLLCLERLSNDFGRAQRPGHPQIIEVAGSCTARNRDDPDLRPLVSNHHDRFNALLLGHDEVGDYDIWPLVAKNGHCTPAVRSGHHLVTIALEDSRKRVQNEMVVVDHQDLHRPSWRWL